MKRMIPEEKRSFTFLSGIPFVDFVEKAYSAGNIAVRAVDKSVDDVDETRGSPRQNDRKNVNDCKKNVAGCSETS